MLSLIDERKSRSKPASRHAAANRSWRARLAALAGVVGAAYLFRDVWSYASLQSSVAHSSALPATPWYKNESLFSDPFKYTPKDYAKPVRILFLADLEDSIVRHDTFYYEVYEAARRHPGVLPEFWGPGYGGYDITRDWNENIARKYGCGYFDILYTHYGLNKIWDEDARTPSLDCDTLLIVKGGDCGGGVQQCVRDSYLHHGNITIARYAHELFEMYTYPNILSIRESKYNNRQDMQYHLFGHIPDTANEWDFYPVADFEEKSVDAMLFGASHGYYPLRTTVALAIGAGKTFIEPQPPATHIDETLPMYDQVRAHPPNTLQWDDSIHDVQRDIMKSFAGAMRNTKICVFDGSIEHKAVRKFAQAMLSGCVIASDLPTEHDWILKDNIIELDLYATIEDINRAISTALQDPVELQRKAATLLQYARQHLTGTREIDLVIEMARRYRQGERGYTFPTSFTSRCRHYNDWDPEGPTPPWCTGQHFQLQQGWNRQPPQRG